MVVIKLGINEFKGDVFWDFINDKLMVKGLFEK